MKIRIKGASVRFRLSRPEVGALVHGGSVVEETPFGAASFGYEARKEAAGDALRATFEQGIICLHVPEILIRDWDKNDTVSIDAHMDLGNGRSLYLLLEKDFQCLDGSLEDQSDNYVNPNKSC